MLPHIPLIEFIYPHNLFFCKYQLRSFASSILFNAFLIQHPKKLNLINFASNYHFEIKFSLFLVYGSLALTFNSKFRIPKLEHNELPILFKINKIKINKLIIKINHKTTTKRRSKIQRYIYHKQNEIWKKKNLESSSLFFFFTFIFYSNSSQTINITMQKEMETTINFFAIREKNKF